MKKTIKFSLLAIAFGLCASCKNDTASFDTDLTVIVDKTDRMTAYPTADEITSQLGLKDDLWQGVRITATYISDKDINDVTVLTLESENQWSGNIMMRKAKIQHFVKQLQHCLSEMKYSGTCPYSIIYRTIARQADKLATSNAHRKLLLVYSDLYENDTDLNFYERNKMNRLRTNPLSIALQLETTEPLKRLIGLQMWLIYNPTSYKQNQAYMTIAEFYQHLFTTHGAVTHIANKFLPL
jgi:hypothetical protein